MGQQDGYGYNGWDAVDDRTQDTTPVGEQWRQRFALGEQETRRIIFLDDIPFSAYFHNLYKLARISEDVLCLVKNQIPDPQRRGCPACDKRDWTRFIGWFTVIDIGLVVMEGSKIVVRPYTNRAGDKSYSCMRRMFGAYRGSEDQPGELITLRRLAQRNEGKLAGTVWDVTRKGEKSPKSGNDFQPVTKVAVDKIQDYLVSQYQADSQKLKLESYEWAKEFKPLPWDQLDRLVSRPPVQQQQQSSGGGYDPTGGYSDDVPF